MTKRPLLEVWKSLAAFALIIAPGTSAAVDTGLSAIERTKTARLSRAIATSQEDKKTLWDGVYTEEQAKRGEETYRLKCGYCHRDDLRGGFFDDGSGNAPALAGSRAFGSSFSDRWNQLTVGDMFVTIGTTMPHNAPATLSPQAYIDVISYLLKMNEIPAGNTELPPDAEKLGQILITEKPPKG